MNDVDERLRGALHRISSGVRATPDPAALVRQGRRMRRRRQAGVAAACAALLAVVFPAGLQVVQRQVADEGEVLGPAAGQTTSGRQTSAKAVATSVQLNVGPISSEVSAKLAKDCLTQYEPGAEVGEISHAVRVRSAESGKADITLAVFDEREGLVYGCVSYPVAEELRATEGELGFNAGIVGGDPVAAARYKSKIRVTDSTHLVAPTDVIQSTETIRLDDKPDLLTFDRWYRVDAKVGSMRQRIIVDGEAGPWFVADAVDGHVLQRSWSKATLREGDSVRVQTQVLDHDGEPLPSSRASWVPHDETATVVGGRLQFGRTSQ